MKRVAVVSFVLAVLFLLLATGVTFFIQPAKAASLTILSHSGYIDFNGFYMIVGEVQNLDTTPVGGLVQITATYYDSSNTTITDDFGYAGLTIILPNQKSPFYITLVDKTQVSRIDHYTLEVTSSQYTSTLPLDLKILSSSDHLDTAGWMHITGEVENAAITNATNTEVWATCYDSDGKVVEAFLGFANLTQMLPGQKASFDILIWSGRAPLVKSYVLTASSTLVLTPGPTPTPTAPTSPTPTPTSAAVSQLFTVAWVPPPANAAAATVVTAVAVAVVSIVAAAVTKPVGTPVGKAAEKTRELLPESVKKWLSDFASSKRKPALDQKTGSLFLPTKAEALAYGVSLAVLTISFSYVKVNDFNLILAVLPTILVTAVIVEFVKTFALVVFARKLGVWTEHRLWYFGLAMFLVTTFAFGIPFSSPSRSLYHAPEFTKRREGIVSAAAILVTLAFGGVFFVLLVSGFTLIGSTGLAMCIIMAFLDTFPVAPMNGKAILAHSKAAWAVLFAATLAVYISWLILL